MQIRDFTRQTSSCENNSQVLRIALLPRTLYLSFNINVEISSRPSKFFPNAISHPNSTRKVNDHSMQDTPAHMSPRSPDHRDLQIFRYSQFTVASNTNSWAPCVAITNSRIRGNPYVRLFVRALGSGSGTRMSILGAYDHAQDEDGRGLCGRALGMGV